MIKAFLLGLALLFGGAILLVGLLFLPLLLIGLVFKLVILAVLLPLRILGGLAGLAIGLFVVLAKVGLFLLAGLVGLAVFGGGLLILPLLPLLAIGLAIWVVIRLMRPRAIAARVA